jgi:hypothetical protein
MNDTLLTVAIAVVLLLLLQQLQELIVCQMQSIGEFVVLGRYELIIHIISSSNTQYVVFTSKLAMLHSASRIYIYKLIIMLTLICHAEHTAKLTTALVRGCLLLPLLIVLLSLYKCCNSTSFADDLSCTTLCTTRSHYSALLCVAHITVSGAIGSAY